MNRTFSTAAVLGMTFFALAICLRKTLAISEGLGDRLTTVLILAQVLFGVALLASCAMLIRKRYGRQKTIGPRRFEALQQLRRLLSAVWS